MVNEFARDPDGVLHGPVQRRNTDFTRYVICDGHELPVLRHGSELIVGYTMPLIARIMTSALSKEEYRTFTCDLRRNIKYIGMDTGMTSLMLDMADGAATAADAGRAEALDRQQYQEQSSAQSSSSQTRHSTHTFNPGDCAYIAGLQKRTDLNGQKVVLLRFFDGRWGVKVMAGDENVRVKSENLLPEPPAPPDFLSLLHLDKGFTYEHIEAGHQEG